MSKQWVKKEIVGSARSTGEKSCVLCNCPIQIEGEESQKGVKEFCQKCQAKPEAQPISPQLLTQAPSILPNQEHPRSALDAELNQLERRYSSSFRKLTFPCGTGLFGTRLQFEWRPTDPDIPSGILPSGGLVLAFLLLPTYPDTPCIMQIDNSPDSAFKSVILFAVQKYLRSSTGEGGNNGSDNSVKISNRAGGGTVRSVLRWLDRNLKDLWELSQNPIAVQAILDSSKLKPAAKIAETSGNSQASAKTAVPPTNGDRTKNTNVSPPGVARDSISETNKVSAAAKLAAPSGTPISGQTENTRDSSALNLEPLNRVARDIRGIGRGTVAANMAARGGRGGRGFKSTKSDALSNRGVNQFKEITIAKKKTEPLPDTQASLQPPAPLQTSLPSPSVTSSLDQGRAETAGSNETSTGRQRNVLLFRDTRRGLRKNVRGLAWVRTQRPPSEPSHHVNHHDKDAPKLNQTTIDHDDRSKSVKEIGDDGKEVDSGGGEWSVKQQQALETALKKYPASLCLPVQGGGDAMSVKQRWLLIAQEVEGKTEAQCVARYKHLRDQVKARRAGAQSKNSSSVSGPTRTTTHKPVSNSTGSTTSRTQTSDPSLNDHKELFLGSDSRRTVSWATDSSFSANSGSGGSSSSSSSSSSGSNPAGSVRRGIEVCLEGIVIAGISLAKLSRLCVTVACGKCATHSDLHLTPGHVSEWQCASCHNGCAARVRGELLHESSDVIAYLDLEGCIANDYLPSDFWLSCTQCLEDVHSLWQGLGVVFDDNCRHCHARLKFSFQRMTFSLLALPSLPLPRRHSAGKVHVVRHSELFGERTKQKKVAKNQFKVGAPLPMQGTCKHYKKSFRWFRFPCCGKAFPCDECHVAVCTANERADRATRMICGGCSREQPISDKDCPSCGQSFTGRSTGHWEGGKGCRDRLRMGRGDVKKFTGLSKTKSAKAERVGPKKDK